MGKAPIKPLGMDLFLARLLRDVPLFLQRKLCDLAKSLTRDGGNTSILSSRLREGPP